MTAAGRVDHPPRDAGSATVVVCGVIMALLLILGLTAHLGAATLARHRAAAAADLGALAGAAKALQGAEAACQRARQVVQANGAQTTSCRIDGLDVLVETSARVWVGWAATATGRARAGPVDEAWSRW